MKTYSAKTAILLLFLPLFAGGCRTTWFDRMPGEPHGRIPWNLRGEYRIVDKGNKKEDIRVKVDEYRVVMRGQKANTDSIETDTLQLHRDFKLTQFGRNLYAMGKQDTLENGNTAWDLQVIRDAGRHVYVHGFYNGAHGEALDKVLRSRDTGELKTYLMDDAAFSEFCSRNLRKKDAILLQRTQ
jgi:hypothetical protein